MTSLSRYSWSNDTILLLSFPLKELLDLKQRWMPILESHEFCEKVTVLHDKQDQEAWHLDIVSVLGRLPPWHRHHGHLIHRKELGWEEPLDEVVSLPTTKHAPG